MDGTSFVLLQGFEAEMRIVSIKQEVPYRIIKVEEKLLQSQKRRSKKIHESKITRN